MCKTLNNYFYKLALLFAATWFMNFTNKIVYCACTFTVLTTILNSIVKYNGRKKAFISILCCTITTLVLLYNKRYCIIPGQPIPGLILTSLSALLIASYIGLNLFSRLDGRYGFGISNSISLLISSFVDHFIMGLFFTRIWPMRKIYSLFYKETVYIFFFGSIVYLFSLMTLHARPFYLRFKRYLSRLRHIKHIKSQTPPL